MLRPAITEARSEKAARKRPENKITVDSLEVSNRPTVRKENPAEATEAAVGTTISLKIPALPFYLLPRKVNPRARGI